MPSTFDKVIGIALWRSGRWYLRRRLRATPKQLRTAPKRVRARAFAAVVATATAGAIALVAQRRSAHPG